MFRNALGLVPPRNRVEWLNDFAAMDLVDPNELEAARWSIFVVAHTATETTAQLAMSLTDEQLTAHIESKGAPGVAADRVPTIQLWVKQLIHFLRSPIDPMASYSIPVPLRYELRRAELVGVFAGPSGDLESLFFGAVIHTLETSRSILPCVAPGCARVFVPGRKGQVYCSTRCQNRAGGARHRAKQARKKAKPAKTKKRRTKS